MKVRVKEGKSGFIYGVYRTEETEFTLKPIENNSKKDKNGNPIVIPVRQQFSDVWMEKIGETSEDAEIIEEEVIEKKSAKKKPAKKKGA